MKIFFRFQIAAMVACLAVCQCNGGSEGEDPVCGDGVCEGSETEATCPADCTGEWVCGDGVCEGPETETTCPADCSSGPDCGNGICDTGETMDTCIQDCPCEAGCDENGDVIICDFGGVEVVHFDCPDVYGSTCSELTVDPGYWCTCGSIPAEGICHSVPDLFVDIFECNEHGFLFPLRDCYEDLGSICNTIGESLGCSCGSVTENGLCYTSPTTGDEYLLGCEEGRMSKESCPIGADCTVQEGVATCLCDNASDAHCPFDNVCPADPDCDIPPEHLEAVKPAAAFVYIAVLGTIWRAKAEWPEVYDCPTLDEYGQIVVNCVLDCLGGIEVTSESCCQSSGDDDGIVQIRTMVGNDLELQGDARISFTPSDSVFSVELTAYNGIWVYYDDYTIQDFYRWGSTAVTVDTDRKETTSDCSDDVYSISGTAKNIGGALEVQATAAGLSINANDKLPSSGTITIETTGSEVGDYAATVTFDESTPSTCQVQVTIDDLTRGVTIPGICS